MTSLKKILGHLRTVTKHRYYVCIECFRVGLYWQGLVHDLSKYSLAEFPVSAKFYQGDRSPLGIERQEYGFSKVWAHHLNYNKHHFQHWLDIPEKDSRCIPIEMPYRYALEMACDFIGAAKTYKGIPLDKNEPLRHWNESVDKKFIHPKTVALLQGFFEHYAETGKLLNS